MNNGDCRYCKHEKTGLEDGHCRYCGITSKNWEKKMELEHIKRNLNKNVEFIDRRAENETTQYVLKACTLRKDDSGFYYEVELDDIKAKSSRLVVRLEDIQEIKM